MSVAAWFLKAEADGCTTTIHVPDVCQQWRTVAARWCKAAASVLESVSRAE